MPEKEIEYAVCPVDKYDDIIDPVFFDTKKEAMAYFNNKEWKELAIFKDASGCFVERRTIVWLDDGTTTADYQQLAFTDER